MHSAMTLPTTTGQSASGHRREERGWTTTKQPPTRRTLTCAREPSAATRRMRPTRSTPSGGSNARSSTLLRHRSDSGFVELDRLIEGDRLRVGPIEAIDGTPGIDIKSALPSDYP